MEDKKTDTAAGTPRKTLGGRLSRLEEAREILQRQLTLTRAALNSLVHDIQNNGGYVSPGTLERIQESYNAALGE